MASNCCGEPIQKYWEPPLFKGVPYSRSVAVQSVSGGVASAFNLTGYTFSLKFENSSGSVLIATLSAPIPSNGVITVAIAGATSTSIDTGEWTGQFFVFNADGSVLLYYEPILTVKEAIA
jgi:hypothetical protein